MSVRLFDHEKAFSLDGETWETNWIMEFTRVQERD
jgi:hypothetical protein